VFSRCYRSYFTPYAFDLRNKRLQPLVLLIRTRLSSIANNYWQMNETKTNYREEVLFIGRDTCQDPSELIRNRFSFVLEKPSSKSMF